LQPFSSFDKPQSLRDFNAIKISIRRQHSSGDVGESDVYGCQQYIPLLDIPIPWDDQLRVLDPA